VNVLTVTLVIFGFGAGMVLLQNWWRRP